MIFTSYSFFIFFAVLLLVYYLVPKRAQWCVLLAFSLFFYASFGIPWTVFLLNAGLSVYIAGYLMGRNYERQKAHLACFTMEKEEKKAYRAREKRRRFAAFLLCILWNLGVLAAVKYTDFAISNLNGLLNIMGREGVPFLRWIQPLGISFYTFQALGYLIDVYRGAVKAERNPLRFLLFVSFFPQLIQGPIGRYEALSQTLYGGVSFDAQRLRRGLQRMLWGYFKKLVIADRIAATVAAITSDGAQYGGMYAALGMVLYTIQLYADFTGGIDIVIGAGETMGVRVAENFMRPYFSKSLKEYWRRWHISMCDWFRSYVFYPVSSSKWMRAVSRFFRARCGVAVSRRITVYLSTAVVWFATGIWHGASWNFIVWGMANWAVLMVSEELEPLYRRFHQRFPRLKGHIGYRIGCVGRTLFLVCCLNLFDCYATVGETLRAFASMLTVHNWDLLCRGALFEIGMTPLDYLIVGIGVALMTVVSLLQRGGSVREQVAALPYPVCFLVWYGLFLAVLLLGVYGIGYDANQFIYNRF